MHFWRCFIYFTHSYFQIAEEKYLFCLFHHSQHQFCLNVKFGKKSLILQWYINFSTYFFKKKNRIVISILFWLKLLLFLSDIKSRLGIKQLILKYFVLILSIFNFYSGYQIFCSLSVRCGLLKAPSFGRICFSTNHS